MKALVLIAGFLLMTACQSSRFSQLQAQDMNQIRQQAVEVLTVDSLQFRPKVYLWRDFQPITPPRGKPLRANIEIHASEPISVSRWLSVEKVILATDKEKWVVEITAKTSRMESPGLLRFTLGNGPFWPPQTRVDVFLFLKDARGNTYWLKVLQQTIHATY